jgi:hypothetical protein
MAVAEGVGASGGTVMQGFITTRHLVTHATTIVGEFGWRVYFRCLARCLRRGKPVTFLSCLAVNEARRA